MNKFIVTLTGPSCSGKSTLEKMLKEAGFAAIRSTTTRPMRAGEVNGQAYDFVPEWQFRDMIKAGQMVEHVEFNGHLYGATVAEFERVFATGSPVVIVVEPNGQQQLAEYAKKNGWECLSVFVMVENEELGRRFLERFVEGMSKIDTCSPSAGAELRKLQTTHARRLATMITTERGWIVDAITTKRYDKVLSKFDSSVDREVVADIRSRADYFLSRGEWTAGHAA